MEWGSDGAMMETPTIPQVRQSRSQNGAGTPLGKKNGFTRRAEWGSLPDGHVVASQHRCFPRTER
jgi:hypothetical protein